MDERAAWWAAVSAAAGGDGDPVEALQKLHSLRDQLDAWEPRLIASARAEGVSWAALAPALGVGSRQAAERRYLRMRSTPGAASTGEARIRAERDRRAGERAVARWARDHAAPLRQLAAEALQAQAMNGMRRRAATLRQALADDDPAALIDPLGALRDQVARTDQRLAGRIDEMLDRTAHVRRRSDETRRTG